MYDIQVLGLMIRKELDQLDATPYVYVRGSKCPRDATAVLDASSVIFTLVQIRLDLAVLIKICRPSSTCQKHRAAAACPKCYCKLRLGIGA